MAEHSRGTAVLSTLFRQSALDALTSLDDMDGALRLSSPGRWLAVLTVWALIVGLGAWSVMAKVPIKIAGQGLLQSGEGIVDVVSATQGRVLKFAIHPGSIVTEGQVIADIDQSEVRLERDLVAGQLDDARVQYERIRLFHERDVMARRAFRGARERALRQSIDLQGQRLNWVKERSRGLNELFSKGIVDRAKMIDNMAETAQILEAMAASENQLKQLDLEEQVKTLEQERELLTAEQNATNLERKVVGLEMQLKQRSAIVSPYDGMVIESKVNTGEYVTPGVSLVTLQRKHLNANAELVAVFYVPPAEGKQILPGMEVDVVPGTVKREESGFIHGKVRSVAEMPSSTQGMMRELRNDRLIKTLAGEVAPLEVVVELELKPDGRFLWSSPNSPTDAVIEPGTLCSGEVTVRNMRLAAVLIPALDRLFRNGDAAP